MNNLANHPFANLVLREKEKRDALEPQLANKLSLASQPAKISPTDAIVSAVARALPMIIGYAGAQSQGAAAASQGGNITADAFLNSKKDEARAKSAQAAYEAQGIEKEIARADQNIDKLEIKGIESLESDKRFKESEAGKDRRSTEQADARVEASTASSKEQYTDSEKAVAEKRQVLKKMGVQLKGLEDHLRKTGLDKVDSLGEAGKTSLIAYFDPNGDEAMAEQRASAMIFDIIKARSGSQYTDNEYRRQADVLASSFLASPKSTFRRIVQEYNDAAEGVNLNIQSDRDDGFTNRFSDVGKYDLPDFTANNEAKIDAILKEFGG